MLYVQMHIIAAYVCLHTGYKSSTPKYQVPSYAFWWYSKLIEVAEASERWAAAMTSWEEEWQLEGWAMLGGAVDVPHILRAVWFCVFMS